MLKQEQLPNPSAVAPPAHPQTPGNATNSAPPPPPVADGPSLRRRILDLRRLLHAMSRPPFNGDDSLPPYVISDRIELSHSMLSHITSVVTHQTRSARTQRIDALITEAENTHLNVDYERMMEEVERLRDEHIRECQREDVLLEGLRRDVERVCRVAQEELVEARARESQEQDIIDELFFAPDVFDDDEGDNQDGGVDLGVGERNGRDGEEGDDYSLGLSEDDNNYAAAASANNGTGTNTNQRNNGSPRPSPPPTHKHHHHHNPNHPNERSEELKRQQAEMLEEEISEMAAQMKAATQRMNTTLVQQSKALDDMEDTVTENLDEVTNVTTKVTDHVRKGWKKTAATWTLFFSVVGTFAFLFMTMRVAPKRRDACLFVSCDKRHRGRYDNEYEARLNEAEEERQRLLEELRMRDEMEGVAGGGEGNDEDGDMVCETLANGSVQCFGGRPKSNKRDRRKKQQEAVDADKEEPGCSVGGSGEPDNAKQQQRHEPRAAFEDAIPIPQQSESERVVDDTEPKAEPEEDSGLKAESEEDSKRSEDKNTKAQDEQDVEEVLSEEERQRLEEEERRRREEHTKRIALEEELRQEREKDRKEAMERMKREKEKEDDRQNAEAFRAYSNYKKQVREDLVEQKKERDRLIEGKETERLAEAAHIAAEKAEQKRPEAERTEAEQERLEQELIAAEEKSQQERLRKEKKTAARAETERIAAEKAEQDRLEQERIAAEEKSRRERKLDEERRQKDKKAAARARVAVEAKKKAEERRIKRERVAAEKAEQDRLEQDRIKAEQEEKEEEENSVSEEEFHFAAAEGRIGDLQSYIRQRPDMVNAPDRNGWTALHEAARGGQADAIRILLEAGADASLRTGRDKKGDDALRLLESSHGTNHPAVALLQQYVAKGHGREETATQNTARSEL